MENPWGCLTFPEEGLGKWQDGSPYTDINKGCVCFKAERWPDPRWPPGMLRRSTSIDSTIFWFPQGEGPAHGDDQIEKRNADRREDVDSLNDQEYIEPDGCDPPGDDCDRRDRSAYKRERSRLSQGAQNETHEVYDPIPSTVSDMNESHTSVLIRATGLPFNAAARGLCDNCSKYNWKCLLEVNCALRFEGYSFKSLKKSNEVKLPKVARSQTSCTLCNFIFRLAKSSPTYDPGSLQDRDIDAACSINKGPKYLSLSFCIGEPGNSFKCGILSPQVLNYYQSAWAPMADIAVLKGFWNECMLSHPECQAATQQYLSSLCTDPVLRFRVIDVVTNRVISAPLNCRYVALSYVWGSHPSRCLRRADFLDSSQGGVLSSDTHVQLDLRSLLPTLSDAMEFVGLMGLRYLWVDQLCIVQDDPEEVSYTMKAMHKIYGASTFTIVASGKDATSGLPCVIKSPRRIDPLIGSVDGITLFHHPPDPAVRGIDPLGESTWDSRGWTYQEFHFSQRQFIFVADRIYYNCGKQSRVETSPGKVLRSMKEYRTLLSTHVPFDKYVTHVEEFSRKSLTYHHDVLNAFNGILSDLRERYGLKSYFGIPLGPGGRGLEWLSKRRLQRRPTFPSWSWAGWIGPVYYSRSLLASADDCLFYYHIRPVDESWGAASRDGILEFLAPHNYINLQDLKSATDKWQSDLTYYGDWLKTGIDGEIEWKTGPQECLLVTTYPDFEAGGLIIVRRGSDGIYYREGYVECPMAMFKKSFIMKTIRLG